MAHRPSKQGSLPLFKRTFVGVLAVGMLLGGCSATAVAPTKGQPEKAELDRALTAWNRFPVGASPRPILLLAGNTLDPEFGFPDTASKIAYGEGSINPPSTWPSSPGSSKGFRIVGASTAFKSLTTPTDHPIGTPETPPLVTTGVQLGSGRFLTDRGYRDLPAWLFALSGVQNPAKVLAVGTASIFSALSTNGGVSPSEKSVTIGSDGRRMVVAFVGAAAGTGACTADYTLSVTESKQAVAVAVITHLHRAAHSAPDLACSAVGYPRHATAELKAPLGARVVVDAQTMGAMVVTGTS
jgi:hypothetical protein